MYVLGYDIGSSSVKASLVNVESGKCAASAFFPKTEAPILAVKQGWAEEDPQSCTLRSESISDIGRSAVLVTLTELTGQLHGFQTGLGKGKRVGGL